MQAANVDMSKEKLLTTKNMTRISILSVISMVLMLLKVPSWFAPPFLKLDLADVPALIGAFAMGPMAGVVIQLLKNALNVLVEGSMTGGVGELSNFIVGSAFVYSAGLVYKREKTYRSALKGLIAGVLLMTLFATFSNYFIVFPIYSKLIPLDKIIQMGSMVNKYVVDYKSLILFAVVPFNLLKGFMASAVTLLVYKKVSVFLKD